MSDLSELLASVGGGGSIIISESSSSEITGSEHVEMHFVESTTIQHITTTYTTTTVTIEGGEERTETSSSTVTTTTTEGSSSLVEAWDVEVGPIWNQSDAEAKAKAWIEAHPGLEWTGAWSTTKWAKMSVISVRPSGKFEVDIGPISDQEDAERKAATYILEHSWLRWTGVWRVVIEGEKWVIEVEAVPQTNLEWRLKGLCLEGGNLTEQPKASCEPSSTEQPKASCDPGPKQTGSTFPWYFEHIGPGGSNKFANGVPYLIDDSTRLTAVTDAPEAHVYCTNNYTRGSFDAVDTTNVGMVSKAPTITFILKVHQDNSNPDSEIVIGIAECYDGWTSFGQKNELEYLPPGAKKMPEFVTRFDGITTSGRKIKDGQVIEMDGRKLNAGDKVEITQVWVKCGGDKVTSMEYRINGELYWNDDYLNRANSFFWRLRPVVQIKKQGDVLDLLRLP